MRGALVAGVIACGCSYPPRARPDPVVLARRLVDATTPAEVKAQLIVPMGYGGLWFADPSCMQFVGAGTIGADRVDAFATCLARVRLRTTDRAQPFPDVVVLSYAPGFEVEAQIDEERGAVRWIGFAGRHDLRDALPAITPAALESLRIAGDRVPVLDDAARARLVDERRQTRQEVSLAWLKVCLDATGAVTGVHARQVSSPIAAEVFEAAVSTWRFRPFVVAGTALPVCSMIRLADPPGALSSEAARVMPYPFPPDLGSIVVAPAALSRISGQIQFIPNDDEKIQITTSGTTRRETVYQLCVDAAGEVAGVRLIRSSGLPGYDAQIGNGVLHWKYEPFVIDGKALPVCTAVNFIYTQH